MIRHIIGHPETIAISKFATVGSIGFAVDAGLLALGIYGFGTPSIPTRMLSVFVSVIVTWALNRIWTFDPRRRESHWIELGRYIGSRAVGGVCNVSIFAAAVNWFSYPFNAPIVATPLSSAMTMVINYGLIRLFIYDPKERRPHM